MQQVVTAGRQLCFVVIFLTLLIAFTGCSPSTNAPANAANTPTNEPAKADKDKSDKPDPKPEPEDKEAKYPFQVIAALAKVYLSYGINDEAVRLYQLAIKTQIKQAGTEDAETWATYGDALVKSNRKQEAVEAYQRSLTIFQALYKQDPNAKPEVNNFRVNRIAQLYKMLGNEQESQKWLVLLKADDNSADQQLQLAVILEQQQMFDKAEACYKKALDLTKADAKATAIVKMAYANMLQNYSTASKDPKRSEDALKMAKEVVATKDLPEETRKAAKLQLIKIYDARGELDKVDFK